LELKVNAEITTKGLVDILPEVNAQLQAD